MVNGPLLGGKGEKMGMDGCGRTGDFLIFCMRRTKILGMKGIRVLISRGDRSKEMVTDTSEIHKNGFKSMITALYPFSDLLRFLPYGGRGRTGRRNMRRQGPARVETNFSHKNQAAKNHSLFWGVYQIYIYL